MQDSGRIIGAGLPQIFPLRRIRLKSTAAVRIIPPPAALSANTLNIMTAATKTFAGLPQLGVLAIDGPDASAFLQGQATCDCRLVTAQRAALGALCNLQGRMIVSFYVVASAAGLHLLMPRDRVGLVLAHLKKYAVFSKVTLRDDSAACAMLGCVDDASGAEPFTVSPGENGIPVLHLRGQRALMLSMNDAAETGVAPCGTGESSAENAFARAWRAASIRAGEVLVDTANAGLFLPQALNYDVIDGVNFRKGCYTGQEVVARMHFKGKMKERLQIFHASGLVAAGCALHDSSGQEIGSVVDAVADGHGALLAAVVRHDALARGSVLANGAPVQRLAAPYAVPDSPP